MGDAANQNDEGIDDPDVTVADRTGTYGAARNHAARDDRDDQTLAGEPSRAGTSDSGDATLPIDDSALAADATLIEGGTPRAPRRPLPVVSGFEIYCELGRGGMGVVYHARRILLDRPCALKMILAGELASPEAATRFLSEAAAVARLRHANILQIYEIGEHNGRTYLELEFAEGGSLAEKIDGTPWPPRRAAGLVEPIARAAAEAHRQGIVHRDLKPANVLLMAEGTPKLCDFGLAKSIGSNSGLTRTESVMGSPTYMAPEQAAGHSREVGPTADVYSLGTILYELLTGRAPFRAATVLETLEQVRSAEPVWPSRLVPGTPRDLETVCLKCLDKDPNRRYPTATELADDLRRYLHGDTILARRSAPLERAWRWCRRNPTIAALTGAVAALLLAATALSTVLLISETRSNRRILAALGDARAQTTRLAAERGIALFDQRDGAGALLWLARALATDPTNEAGLQHAIRVNMTRAAREQVPAPRAIIEGNRAGRIAAVAYSPDARRAAVAHGPGTVRVIDVASGKVVGSLDASAPNASVSALGFSPDGTRLLVGAATYPRDKPVSGRTQAWDVAGGKRVGKPIEYPGVPRSYSPDAMVVAAQVGDMTFQLCDVATGKPVGKALVHDQQVSCVAFAPDGKTVVTGEAPPDRSGQSRALLWNAKTGGLIWTSDRHPGWHIYGVAFSPDSKIVATAANDRHVRLFDAGTGRQLGAALKNPEQVGAVAFSPDGRTIAAGMAMHTSGATERAEVRLWDRATGKVLGPDLPHEGGVMDVAFSPDGATLLSGSSDGTAYLWELPDGPPIGRPMSRGSGDVCLAFTPDGRSVLSAGFESRIVQHDVATGRAAGPVLAAGKFVWQIAVSPDGRTVAAGLGLPASTNQSAPGFGEARMWDRATGRPIGEPMPHHTDRLKSIAFSPDGKALLTADIGAVRFWDASNGRNLGIDLAATPDSVSAMALSRDGRQLLVADAHANLRLWNLVSMQVKVLRQQAHRGLIADLAISPDGRFAASASWDKTARVWNMATGEPHGPFLRHDGSVQSIAFNPDGRIVATGGEDRTVRLWDRATGMRLGSALPQQSGGEAVAFSPDGRLLGIASLDDTAIWDVPAPALGTVDAMGAWAEAVTGRTLDDEGAITPLLLTAWRGRREAAGAADPPPRSPDADAQRHLALIERAEADSDWYAALWHLDRLIAARPADGALLAHRVSVLARAGRAAEATRGLTDTIARVDDASALRELADALDQAGQKQGAVAALSRAAERSTDTADLDALAEHLARLEQWSAAGTALARAVHGDPSRLELWGHLVVLRLRASDVEGYRAACGEVLKTVSPSVAPARANGLAWPFALGPDGASDYAAPLALAERSVTGAASPQEKAASLNTLGGVLLRAGRYDEAIKRLEEGMKLGPGDGSPHDWAFLALACQRAGRNDDAQRWAAKLAASNAGGQSSFWDDLEIQLLRREVAAAVSTKSP
jgi:WD40 repeat protein/tetratricopeptide (TPR) repeat protein